MDAIPVGTPWTGSDEEQAELLGDLDEAVRWSKEHNIPINVGEFGAYSKADMKSRACWTAFLFREMEKARFLMELLGILLRLRGIRSRYSGMANRLVECVSTQK